MAARASFELASLEDEAARAQLDELQWVAHDGTPTADKEDRVWGERLAHEKEAAAALAAAEDSYHEVDRYGHDAVGWLALYRLVQLHALALEGIRLAMPLSFDHPGTFARWEHCYGLAEPQRQKAMALHALVDRERERRGIRLQEGARRSFEHESEDLADAWGNSHERDRFLEMLRSRNAQERP